MKPEHGLWGYEIRMDHPIDADLMSDIAVDCTWKDHNLYDFAGRTLIKFEPFGITVAHYGAPKRPEVLNDLYSICHDVFHLRPSELQKTFGKDLSSIMD